MLSMLHAVQRGSILGHTPKHPRNPAGMSSWPTVKSFQGRHLCEVCDLCEVRQTQYSLRGASTRSVEQHDARGRGGGRFSFAVTTRSVPESFTVRM